MNEKMNLISPEKAASEATLSIPSLLIIFINNEIAHKLQTNISKKYLKKIKYASCKIR